MQYLVSPLNPPSFWLTSRRLWAGNNRIPNLRCRLSSGAKKSKKNRQAGPLTANEQFRQQIEDRTDADDPEGPLKDRTCLSKGVQEACANPHLAYPLERYFLNWFGLITTMYFWDLLLSYGGSFGPFLNILLMSARPFIEAKNQLSDLRAKPMLGLRFKLTKLAPFSPCVLTHLCHTRVPTEILL